MYSRRAALDVHEWEGRFKGQAARFKMTSVIGHVYSIDFTAAFNNWDKVRHCVWGIAGMSRAC